MVKGYGVDSVFYVVLDRPGKLNSLDSNTLDGMVEYVTSACNGDYAVIVITGEGRLFSAGMDLGEIAGASDPSSVEMLFKRFSRLLEALISCRGPLDGVVVWKPVVSLLNGPAVAGGAEIALASDIIVAAGNGFLQWPEVRWGLVPPMLAGLTGSMGGGRLVWSGLAMERISFEEAYRMGIVSKLVGSVDEGKRVIEDLSKIVKRSPLSIHYMLDPIRNVKRSWINGVGRLVELAGRRELIEEARKFISRKG